MEYNSSFISSITKQLQLKLEIEAKIHFVYRKQNKKEEDINRDYEISISNREFYCCEPNTRENEKQNRKFMKLIFFRHELFC